MATEITTKIKDIALTSELDSISATTDEEKVTVRVTLDPDGEADEFFTASLYAYDGTVELSEVGRLIEDRLRALGLSRAMVGVAIGDASADFTAIHCTHRMDSDFDHAGCYWTTAATAVVHPGSVVSLSHWDDGSLTYVLKVVGVNADGSTGMVEKEFARAAGSDHLSFTVDSVISFGLDQSEYETGGDLEKVSYFAVNHGPLQKIFYVADEPEYMVFGFRNMFNCPEYVDVSGKVKRKMAVERDLAVCGGVATQYNQVANLTYEVETGPLTEDQAMTIEELVLSHGARLVCGDRSYDILITDHTCERDNDDGSPLSMKFTYRYTSDRPTLPPADMRALAPVTTDIFSEEFTAEFA